MEGSSKLEHLGISPPCWHSTTENALYSQAVLSAILLIFGQEGSWVKWHIQFNFQTNLNFIYTFLFPSEGQKKIHRM